MAKRITLPFVYTSFDTLVEDGRGEEERDGDVPMLETPAGRRGQRRAKKRMLELELINGDSNASRVYQGSVAHPPSDEVSGSVVKVSPKDEGEDSMEIDGGGVEVIEQQVGIDGTEHERSTSTSLGLDDDPRRLEDMPDFRRSGSVDNAGAGELAASLSETSSSASLDQAHHETASKGLPRDAEWNYEGGEGIISDEEEEGVLEESFKRPKRAAAIASRTNTRTVIESHRQAVEAGDASDIEEDVEVDSRFGYDEDEELYGDLAGGQEEYEEEEEEEEELGDEEFLEMLDGVDDEDGSRRRDRKEEMELGDDVDGDQSSDIEPASPTAGTSSLPSSITVGPTGLGIPIRDVYERFMIEPELVPNSIHDSALRIRFDMVVDYLKDRSDNSKTFRSVLPKNVNNERRAGLFKILLSGLADEAKPLLVQEFQPTAEELMALPWLPNDGGVYFSGIMGSRLGWRDNGYIGSASARPTFGGSEDGSRGIGKRVAQHRSMIKNDHIKTNKIFYNTARKHCDREVEFRTIWSLPMPVETLTSREINHLRLSAVFIEGVLTIWLRTLHADIPEIPFWPLNERTILGTQYSSPLSEGPNVIGGVGNVWSVEVMEAYILEKRTEWRATRKAKVRADRLAEGNPVKFKSSHRSKEDLEKAGRQPAGRWRDVKKAYVPPLVKRVRSRAQKNRSNELKRDKWAVKKDLKAQGVITGPLGKSVKWADRSEEYKQRSYVRDKVRKAAKRAREQEESSDDELSDEDEGSGEEVDTNEEL